MTPIDNPPLTRAALEAAMAERALEVSSVTGMRVTAADLERMTLQMESNPLGTPTEAPEPPQGYTRAPRLDTYKYIPKDGSPNVLLERLPLREALTKVTREHRKIAEWIRGQKGRPGWDLDKPTREMWGYIHASKRMKRCRDQLQEMWDEVMDEVMDEDSEGSDQSPAVSSAQHEANMLAALEEMSANKHKQTMEQLHREGKR